MKNKFCKISIGILSICMMFLICLHFDVFKNSSKLKADINSVPEGSLITDHNLYKCAIECYHDGEYGINSNNPYTHLFTEGELSEITTLDCLNTIALDEEDIINNTTGIEKMTGLTLLNLTKRGIKNIDLSKNINLTNLYLADNEITSLDLSKNTKLKRLNVSDNSLTSLDLSKNDHLEALIVSSAFNSNITIDSLSYELLTLPSEFDFEYGITSYNNSSTKINVNGTKVLPLSAGNETVVYNINGENVSINYTIPESIFVAESDESRLTSIKISVESSSGNGEITKSDLENNETGNIYIEDPFLADVESINITATPFDSKATVSGDIGTKTLKSGKNTFVITVKAEDETVRSYNLIITKKESDEVTYKVGEKVKVKLNDNLTKEFYVLNSFDDTYALLSNEMIEGTYTFDEATQKIEELKALWTNVNEVFIPYAENLVLTKAPTNGLKFSEPTFLLNGYKYWAFETGASENEHFTISTLSPTEGEESISVNTEKLYLRPAININKKHLSKIETVSSNENCLGILSSSKYEIDNDKKVINKVDKNESVEEIRNNITSDCGSIVVSENNVVLTYNGNIKSYKIERYWAPKTGQTIIKYGLIITCLLIIIGLLIYILRKNK